jgi:iron(III) transport system substrate-binding protein
MRLSALTATIGASLALAACGGGPPSEGGGSNTGDTGYEKVFAAIKGLHGKQRIDKLVKLSEQEGGELSLYTSLTSDVEDAVSKAFKDAYGIDPSVYRADSETVLKRLGEESNAGFRGADVVETNGPELYNLNKEHVLVEYQPDALPNLVPGSDFQGWTASRFNKFVVSWNTKLVPNGQQPKSWEELADPKWDGKVTLELGDVEWYKTLYEYFVSKGKTPEQAQKLFEDIAQGSQVVKGHTVIGELMAAGDIPVAASNYSYLVQQLADKGAPVEWHPPVEPIISRPNGVGLVTRARHPATAILFEEWLLGDGQKVLADQRLDAARKDLATAQGAKEIRVNLDSLIAHQDEWTARYDKLTQLGSEAGK